MSTAREVRHTECFDRVAALPRRTLSEREANTWSYALTPDLARRPGVKLLPWQALAIVEAVENNGALLGLPVGSGKTLICEVLPVLMRAKRPILVIPAGLRDKTYSDRRALASDWRTANPPARIVSIEELAPERGQFLLDTIQPDLIVIDECDTLANRQSSAARRIDRYVVAHPECRVVAMTGSLVRKSLMNFWHIICWCLRERAPVPMREAEALTWADATDEGQAWGRGQMAPGPLGATSRAAQAWFQRRLAETPGVVIVDGDTCDAPLTIRVRLARECPETDAHYQRFLTRFETPGEMLVTDPLSRWRLDSQLGSGFYHYLDPAPPEYWRAAWREYARFVRDTIERSGRWRRPLDTEAQVRRAHSEHPAVAEWLAVRDDYDSRKHTKTRWLSDAAIRSVCDWLHESPAPGIVWCGSVEFADALSAATRLPYYGRRGRTASGDALHAADPSQSIICSWYANKRGFNLQPWARQLICQPPQSAKYLEQIFGRSHRTGQESHVVVDWLATSGGSLDSFEAAIAEAGFGRRLVGQTQKLLRAEIVRATPTRTRTNNHRWARRET